MELKKYKLADIADFNKSSISRSETFKEIIYLDTSSITENVVSGTAIINIKEAPSRAQRKVTNNTIIYSTVRPRLKHYGILSSPQNNFIVSTGFATIDIKDSYKYKIDPRYLYLLLTQQTITNYIGNIADTAVSAYPSINPSDLSSLCFMFPDYDIQKTIADIWNNYDCKIALNRALNQNLEAMAKQLYDYWFVQFDYPDENGKPYKSNGGKIVWNKKLKREIPADWEVLPLFDVVSVQYGFPFATEQFTEEETNVPVVRIRDILEGTTSAYSLEKADEKYHLNENDVLVGMDGNFHMNFWHDNIAYLNQRCVRLRAHSDSTISSIQILHSIKPYIKAKEQNAKGSTVGHLSDKDLKGLYLIKPLKTRAFNPRKTLDGLLALVIENKKQILSLTKQRDELLPLLINGQITIE